MRPIHEVIKLFEMKAAERDSLLRERMEAHDEPAVNGDAPVQERPETEALGEEEIAELEAQYPQIPD